MFKLLTTFRAVYETRNFSRAAEVLFYLNQQSRIKSNSWAGIEYRSFQRNGRKEMLPTKQADLLYERTLVLLEEWEETQQNCSMNKMKKKYVGSLLPTPLLSIFCLS